MHANFLNQEKGGNRKAHIIYEVSSKAKVQNFSNKRKEGKGKTRKRKRVHQQREYDR